MKDILKPIVMVLLGLLMPPLVAYLARRSDGWRRLLMVIAIVTFFLQPVMTFDYHFGARNNVRGWEVCWADLIGIGLFAACVGKGAAWRAWVNPLCALGVVYFAMLGLSCLTSIDPMFSFYHLARVARGLGFMWVMILLLREPEDFEAVVLGIAAACLVNERQVLIDKYQIGRFQCPGMFDHQNAMGMYMGLCGPALFAALMWRGVRPRFSLVVWAGFLASGHSVAASLSRASLLAWAVAVALTGLATLGNGIDRHKARILAGCVVVAMLGGVMMLGSLEARVSDERSNLASKRTREVMNDAARAMGDERPWTGWGLNSYAVVVNRQPFADMIDVSEKELGHRIDEDYSRGVVESMYLQYRAETGRLGFWSFIAFIAGTLITGLVKAVRLRDATMRACALGALLGLSANYLQLTLEHTLVNYANMYLWMTWCAVLAALPWKNLASGPLAPAPVVAVAMDVATDPGAIPAVLAAGQTPAAPAPDGGSRPGGADDDDDPPMFWT